MRLQRFLIHGYQISLEAEGGTRAFQGGNADSFFCPGSAGNNGGVAILQHFDGMAVLGFKDTEKSAVKLNRRLRANTVFDQDDSAGKKNLRYFFAFV